MLILNLRDSSNHGEILKRISQAKMDKNNRRAILSLNPCQLEKTATMP